MKSLKKSIFQKIESFKVGKRLLNEHRYRIVFGAALSLVVNMAYALYHGILGVFGGSVWLLTMCAYYTVLGTMRFSAVLCERKNKGEASGDMEYFVMRLCGSLLVVLSLVLSGVIYISLAEKIASKHEFVLMITIATYTFYKITMEIISAVKQHGDPSPLLKFIRSIRYADVAVSILTLQRSMLVSFGFMYDTWAHLMIALTGAAVCLFIFILGVHMAVKGRRKNNGKIKTCCSK